MFLRRLQTAVKAELVPFLSATGLQNINAFQERMNAKMQQLYDARSPKTPYAIARNMHTSLTNVALYNAASQSYCTSLFLDNICAANTTSMSPQVEQLLMRSFGSVAQFKILFSQTANAIFGSGFVFLVHNGKGAQVISRINSFSPIFDTKPGVSSTSENTVLLALNLWEHAYTMDYGVRREEYVDNFWQCVNWHRVDSRLDRILSRE